MLNVEYYLRHYLEVVGVLLEAVNLLSERQEDVVLSGGQELHLALHDGLEVCPGDYLALYLVAGSVLIGGCLSNKI